MSFCRSQPMIIRLSVYPIPGLALLLLCDAPGSRVAACAASNIVASCIPRVFGWHEGALRGHIFSTLHPRHLLAVNEMVPMCCSLADGPTHVSQRVRIVTPPACRVDYHQVDIGRRHGVCVTTDLHLCFELDSS